VRCEISLVANLLSRSKPRKTRPLRPTARELSPTWMKGLRQVESIFASKGVASRDPKFFHGISLSMNKAVQGQPLLATRSLRARILRRRYRTKIQTNAISTTPTRTAKAMSRRIVSIMANLPLVV
jgi:hypothetical protein